MPIIGKLIKAAIGIGSEFRSDQDPVDAQKEVLKKLLDTAKETDFGKKYGFSDILDASDLRDEFRGKLPIFSYSKLYDEGWKDVIDGKENVTWPGKPNYFAVSSGTTGAKKRIPVTEEMVQSIKDTGIRQILSLNNFDLPDEFFEKEILMFGSSTNLEDNEGRKEGQISGISASRIPFWFRGVYKPGEEIASIDDWDERLERIAKEAPNWDIGALSGIPTWIEQVLEKIVEHNELKNIHDIWPHLEVFASGGTAFEPYKKSLEKLMAHPLTYIDTYLASEGFFAFQQRPGTNAMALVCDDAFYFEFVPHKEKYFEPSGSPSKDARALHLGEVQEDEEYVLLISSVSGAWRYSLGDTIKFTDVERAEIRITGRTKHFMNVAGSELTVEDMQKAVEHLEDKFDVSIPEFTVAGIEVDGGYAHRWYLGVDSESEKGSQESISTTLDDREVLSELDDYLKENKSTYKTAREEALKDPEVNIVTDEKFYEYTETLSGRGGQTKIPRVMSEEKFEHWETFVKKKSH